MENILRSALLVLFTILLSGCSTGIDPENPEKSVGFLQDHFEIEVEAEETQFDMKVGIKDGYAVRDDISVILNEEKNIEEITLNDLDKEEAVSLLKTIDFPVTDSMEQFMDSNESEMEFQNIGEPYFTSYKGVGVHLFKKGEIFKKVLGNKDFRVRLLYNEERFDDFKE